MKYFVKYIFDECSKNKILILRPLQDNPDDMWNFIMNRKKIENPS
jgi:hypothetical protein